MRIISIGSNMTEVDTGHALILISYSTPVAARVGGKPLRTEKKHSKTTTHHINKWLNGSHAEYAPQQFFDSLLENAYGDA